MSLSFSETPSNACPPEARRIGIIGGGQLGRMLALAGIPLGLEFVFLDPAQEACAATLGEQIIADYDDPEALQRLIQSTDIVTLEFENIPMPALHLTNAQTQLFPPPKALEVAQDRVNEKTLFAALEIPTPLWRAVDSLHDLEQAVAAIGLPAVLKTRRLGYDGKGQYVLRSQDDIQAAWDELGRTSLILEGFIQFDREVSLIAVRSRSGELAFYPLSENTHEAGILKLSLSRSNDPMQSEAEAYARRVLESLDYVGTLGFEFFVSPSGLIANEIAPRVHNTGHWTIEGAVCSQFENHLRAILGLPLGSTALRGASAMLNFIGDLPSRERALSVRDLYFHAYGKGARKGRKVGHATLVVGSEGERDVRLGELLALSTA
ncbi:MAG TPA: 5-(carboxyamino)imidazole ribonucleotide synthase [bacterium]|nr:5-(carboxyamino)imidazole ribonucleotide synthase [bacterium]